MRDEYGGVVAAVVALAVSGSGAVILSCLQGVDGVQDRQTGSSGNFVSKTKVLDWIYLQISVK